MAKLLHTPGSITSWYNLFEKQRGNAFKSHQDIYPPASSLLEIIPEEETPSKKELDT